MQVVFYDCYAIMVGFGCQAGTFMCLCMFIVNGMTIQLICYYCLKMRCCLCIFLQRRKRKCRGVDQNSVVGYFTSSDTIISLICAIPPSALYWFQVIFDILFVSQSLLRLFACNSPLLSWLDWPSSCNKNQKGGLGSQSREAITSLRRTLVSF